ncbi:M48 family metallopeptidase [Glaciecola sp. MH2013]|uniref:M48 family metallopeptidase n=1 Tax=Glaciecola sp. MH2013 TaxID=2785524 RepID=UPI0018A050EB|nr:M48 family metallopeptidase [Glaciecola sp. MH2013]MBF7074120.1 M48 family metallopeptidase [Glaciecola sp. MH2013]
MMKIDGRLYQKDSAASAEASLYYEEGSYTISSAAGTNHSADIGSVSISSRIGTVERKITLADGTVFATSDNDAIDTIVKQQKGLNGSSSFIHAIESKMRWVVVALCVTVVFSVAFIRWGIPGVSYAIANSLPHSVNEMISGGSFDFLDSYVFDESLLDEERKAEITQRFHLLVEEVIEADSEVKYEIYFRAWGDEEKGIQIPNALALPSGQIILTDKFVELATTQAEIDAVLLHEIGHVTHRHGLKMLIQGTIVATVVTLVAGDASAFADMGLGLGSLLMSSHYSRKHETESDHYAFTQMLALGIDPASFSSIMDKMTTFVSEKKMGTLVKQSTDDADAEEDVEEAAEFELDDGRELSVKKEETMLDYLSSHPKTEERIAQANRFSACFKQGKTECE